MKANKTILFKLFAAGVFLYLGIVPAVFADIVINVVAVNATNSPKTSPIKFDLPGELTPEDILDTNGLQLDYSVDDADYFVHGDVTLGPKASKTFRIHVKDVWMVTPQQVTDLKDQIEQGYKTLGLPYNAANAEVLKSRLDAKIDYIVGLQSSNEDSVDKRIDDYRAYAKEMKRIEDNALDTDYWRSNPAIQENPKIIHLEIEANNPTKKIKHAKIKEYLPPEVKPEDVVEAQDFEVRFDDARQQSFLIKEEDIGPGQTKKYSIGILDIWNIDQSNIDYLRSRAKKAFDVLKDTQYQADAQVLMDRITAELGAIESSQRVQRPILDHISAYRTNKVTYESARQDVETLEKLVAVFREDLEKSKVENILDRIQALKGVSDVSKVMFNKKFETATAWSYIGWTLLFVALLTLISFVVSLLRAKDKKIGGGPPSKQEDGS